MYIQDQFLCNKLAQISRMVNGKGAYLLDKDADDSAALLLKAADRIRALSQLCWSLGSITSFDSIPTLENNEDLCQKNEK